MAETRKKQFWIVAFIILVTAIVVTASIAWTRYRPSLPIEITLPPPQTISGNIYVGGAVTNPGIYTFSGDDTVASLLQAARRGGADGDSGSLELNIAEAKSPPRRRKSTSIPRRVAAGRPAGHRDDQSASHHRLPRKNGFFRNIDKLTE